MTLNGSSAYYVNSENVQILKRPKAGEGVDGRVLGYVIQQKKGKTLVQLSGEAVLGGLRTWVESSAVSPA